MDETIFFAFFEICVIISLPREWEQSSRYLRDDFKYFLRNKRPKHQYSVQVKMEKSTLGSGSLLAKLGLCAISGLWNNRRCVFADGSFVQFRSQNHGRTALIGAAEEMTAYFRAYFFILSVVGEILEKFGWQRFHALGFELEGLLTLAILPSGWGKSTMAASILKSTNGTLLSDEIILVRGEIIRPFPIRIALSKDQILSGTSPDDYRLLPSNFANNKITISVPENRILSKNCTEKKLILGSNGKTVFHKLKFYLFTILGVGLPQMALYLVRIDSIGSLLFTAIRRVVTLKKLRRDFDTIWMSKQELWQKDFNLSSAEVSRESN